MHPGIMLRGVERARDIGSSDVHIFIGWSGERSKQLGLILKSWLPDVIQAVVPWMSETDIEAGANWRAELLPKLSEATFAIFCLTRENLGSPWLHFEAGATSKALEDSRVCPMLLDVATSEVRGPLTLFQMLGVSQEDVLKLLRSINKHSPNQLSDDRLQSAFAAFWDDFLTRVQGIPAPDTPAPEPRTERDILRETLDLVREQHRAISDLTAITINNLNPYLFTLTDPTSYNLSAIRAGINAVPINAAAINAPLGKLRNLPVSSKAYQQAINEFTTSHAVESAPTESGENPTDGQNEETQPDRNPSPE